MAVFFNIDQQWPLDSLQRVLDSQDNENRGDRSSDPATGHKWGEDGLGLEAEVAAVYGLAKFRDIDPKIAVEEWEKNAKRNRPNVGEDIIGDSLNYKLNLEIKATADDFSGSRSTGILTVRVGNGDDSPSDYHGKGSPLPKFEYWKAYLPESYYLLLRHVRKHKFQFHGYAVKGMFLRDFHQNYAHNLKWGMRGYAIIGIWHWRLRTPEDFIGKRR